MSNSSEENKLVAERRAKLNGLRERGNAFPNDWRRDALAADLQKQFAEHDKPTLETLGHRVKVAGRIMRKRGAFMVLQDVSGQIQLYINRKVLSEAEAADVKTWDIGDIVGIEGPVQRSGKGDLFVDMHSVVMLTKSLRPLPDKFHGLTDTEQRYRQRYVDLIMNEDSRNVFATRSAVIQSIRNFLGEKHFMEVETPMMHVIPGGASARPFVTHHNALDMDLYLRIAPELYLKRLVVGGYERVYEINRNFRNEGLSTRHNPEFTMLEFYQAYADYRDLMDLTEGMIRQVCLDVLGSTDVVNTTKNSDGEVVDSVTYEFGKPFARLSMFDSVLAYNPTLKAEDINTLEGITAVAKSLGVKIEARYGYGKILTEVFEETVEARLIQPTFITDYPTEVSPLARRSDDNPDVTDRFEFFIGGREIANGFSELNDAEDQASRFAAQVADKDAGDDEAMHFDHDYIRALEYGLPPTAGEGIGIDRLVMLLTNSPSIRDVLLFPHMRPE